tara:strand:- start:176 stop:364 length:189 start_codon:yes stop_codon:yes gene_type:complete
MKYDILNANFIKMKNPIGTHKLSDESDVSTNMTAQRKQALAQIEATLSRKEFQKVSEKSQKI